MKPSTYINYRRRLRRVTETISDFASQRMAGARADISLGELAESACWCPEHLCRVWSEAAGEAPLATLRRTLMEMSASTLLCERSVTHVARLAGYSSTQSFARAFRRHHGMPASVFRDRMEPRFATQAPEVRVLELRESIPIVTATYSGLLGDAGDFCSSIYAGLSADSACAGRFTGLFIEDSIPDLSASMDEPVEFRFGLKESQIGDRTVRLDKASVAAGLYGVIECSSHEHGAIDAGLAEQGLVSTDGAVVEWFATDRAITPKQLRREYLLIPVQTSGRAAVRSSPVPYGFCL